MAIFNTQIKGGGSAPAVINPLNVTPSTSSQTINPSAGVDGFAPVNVSAVTSSIDANIVAGNIKNGVSILGVTGNYTGSSDGGMSRYQVSGDTIERKAYVFTGHEFDGITTIRVNSLAFAFDWALLSGVVSFPDLTTVNSLGLGQAFSNTAITSAMFSSLTNLQYAQSLYHTLSSCNSLQSINFPLLTTVSGSESLYGCVDSCTNLTSASFPALTTVSGQSGMNRCLSNTKLSTMTFPELLTISGRNGMSSCLYYCSSLTTVSFPKLTTVGERGLYGAISSCSSLTSVSLPVLETAGVYGLSNFLMDDTSLTTMTFPALSNIGQGCLAACFSRDTSLTTVSFPALTSNSFNGYTDQFNKMLSSCSNVTVHFPSNLSSVIGSWSDVLAGFGGTNTTVLFDLPATE